MDIIRKCTVKKKYIRYNPQTGNIEYCQAGKVIQATENELKEFPDCMEIDDNYGGDE